MKLLKFEHGGAYYKLVTDEPQVGDFVIGVNQVIRGLVNPSFDLRKDILDPAHAVLWRAEGVKPAGGLTVEWVGELDLGTDEKIRAFRVQNFTFGFRSGNCWLIHGLGDNPNYYGSWSGVGVDYRHRQGEFYTQIPCPIHTPQHPSFYRAANYPGQPYGYQPQGCVCGMHNPPKRL